MTLFSNGNIHYILNRHIQRVPVKVCKILLLTSIMGYVAAITTSISLFHSRMFFNWATGVDRPASGSLMKILTSGGETQAVAAL